MMTERRISWTEFCRWLEGKRVISEAPVLEGTILRFSDGSACRLESQMSEPTQGYSELTPGSDGHLLPPIVYLIEHEEPEELVKV